MGFDFEDILGDTSYEDAVYEASLQCESNWDEEEDDYEDEIRYNEIIDTAIDMARMWGIMETLEGIPSMKEIPTKNDAENKENLVAWAEEYLNTEQTDMAVFLKEKLQEFI